MPLLAYKDILPRVASDCWIAPGAMVIGDVELGVSCSVWFGTVVRGDVFHIRVGDRTNIQDNSVVHVTTGKHATLVGNDVTIGHRVMLHGCTIEDGALIGMGAIVMDRAVVGQGALVGAGAIVTEGTIIPPQMLAIGAPARPVRPLTDDERARLARSAPHYVSVTDAYRRAYGLGQDVLATSTLV
ncbi:MAG: gamma carbonic anhydrase family protein [Deltaproteobacteria bacterium]|nr:gamma carbonic anhydrase family protein [Deltaproteobacteria bacterium]